jgi:hypothetical protein
MVNNRVPLGMMSKRRKQFFFEKKNQKTFVNLAGGRETTTS